MMPHLNAFSEAHRRTQIVNLQLRLVRRSMVNLQTQSIPLTWPVCPDKRMQFDQIHADWEIPLSMWKERLRFFRGVCHIRKATSLRDMARHMNHQTRAPVSDKTMVGCQPEKPIQCGTYIIHGLDHLAPVEPRRATTSYFVHFPQ
jgi:hypothetical protein